LSVFYFKIHPKKRSGDEKDKADKRVI
jgi:hypothetical protein